MHKNSLLLYCKKEANFNDVEAAQYLVKPISESRCHRARRKRQQEELRLSLERHNVIVDQASDIIFEWDILFDTIAFSPNWKKRFGYGAIDKNISGKIWLGMSRRLPPLS